MKSEALLPSFLMVFISLPDLLGVPVEFLRNMDFWCIYSYEPHPLAILEKEGITVHNTFDSEVIVILGEGDGGDKEGD
jgi:hypothetical protein